jgi:FkbM family methyltransferase
VSLLVSSDRVPLEQLLDVSDDDAASAASSHFDERTCPFERELVLFGAGQLGQKTARGLRELGVRPKAFADNNPQLWGTKIEGVPVYAPEEAAQRFKDDSAFVVTLWSPGIVPQYCRAKEQLSEHGCERIVPFMSLFWKYPETFLPHFTWTLPQDWLRHRDEILQVQNLWSDDESRALYAAHWQWRLTLDYDVLPAVSQSPQYFPAELAARRGAESFVDCGAFDGDSLEAFLQWCDGDFREVTALEPDPVNFLKLQSLVARLPREQSEKIRLLQNATGARRDVVQFQSTGTASAQIGDGDISVEVVPLDEVLQESSPTYIKMDIEGWEPDTLIGATETITRARPRLAVCIYHQLEHFWTLPLQMKSLCPDHSFLLRAHGAQGWDWVCYAMPRA